MPSQTTSTPYSGPERRQHQRLVFDTIVNVTRKDKSYFFDFALNFSQQGFFFETTENFMPDEIVHVLFPLPMSTWVFEARAQKIGSQNKGPLQIKPNQMLGHGFKILSFSKKEDELKIQDYFKNPPNLDELKDIL